MKCAGDRRIIKSRQRGKCPGGIPAGASHDDPSPGIHFPNRFYRAEREIVPQFRRNVAHLIEQFKRNGIPLMPPSFQLQPQSDETLLERLILQQRNRFGDVAAVADCLVEIQHDMQMIFSTPVEKLLDLPENRFPPDSRRGFQYDLIESEPDVIHSPGGDPPDVILGDVALKVFQISNRDRMTPRFRKHMKSLVIGQPAADSHSAAESGKGVVLFHPCAFPFLS